MNAMASHITSVSMVCSTVCSGAYQRKHQRSALLASESGDRWIHHAEFRLAVVIEIWSPNCWCTSAFNMTYITMQLNIDKIRLVIWYVTYMLVKYMRLTIMSTRTMLSLLIGLREFSRSIYTWCAHCVYVERWYKLIYKLVIDRFIYRRMFRIGICWLRTYLVQMHTSKFINNELTWHYWTLIPNGLSH